MGYVTAEWSYYLRRRLLVGVATEKELIVIFHSYRSKKKKSLQFWLFSRKTDLIGLWCRWSSGNLFPWSVFTDQQSVWSKRSWICRTKQLVLSCQHPPNTHFKWFYCTFAHVCNFSATPASRVHFLFFFHLKEGSWALKLWYDVNQSMVSEGNLEIYFIGAFLIQTTVLV